MTQQLPAPADLTELRVRTARSQSASICSMAGLASTSRCTTCCADSRWCVSAAHAPVMMSYASPASSVMLRQSPQCCVALCSRTSALQCAPNRNAGGICDKGQGGGEGWGGGRLDLRSGFAVLVPERCRRRWRAHLMREACTMFTH